jgi:molecular chaperone GrpE
MRKKTEVSPDGKPQAEAAPEHSLDDAPEKNSAPEIEEPVAPTDPAEDGAAESRSGDGAATTRDLTLEDVAAGTVEADVLEGEYLSPDASAKTQELSIDDTSARTQELNQQDYVAAIVDELDDARRRIEEAEDRADKARKIAEEAAKKLMYLQAEFQNYRRRRDDERSSDLKHANSELIKQLLPIIDNFERALDAAERTSNFEALVGGVSGTLKQLQAFLSKAGVHRIEALGQEFDPNFHEAIGASSSDEYPANTVAEEIQPGYVMHEKVLRPSLVKVAQG